MKLDNYINNNKIFLSIIVGVIIIVLSIFITTPNSIILMIPFINSNEEIANYIDDTESELKDIRSYMRYTKDNINSSVYENDKEYINTLRGYKRKVENIIIEISQSEPPEELNQYNKLTIEYLNTSNSIITLTLNASIITDKQDKKILLNEGNLLIKQYNELTNQMNEELISIFEELNIDYRIHNNRISYWWK